jgi:DNA-directed RNA polymerase subunit RPC12/RpoP
VYDIARLDVRYSPFTSNLIIRDMRKLGVSQRIVAGLILSEQEMMCPHCQVKLIVSSATHTVFIAERACPNCGKKFAIVNDVPVATCKSGAA